MRVERRPGNVWAAIDGGVVRGVFQGLADARRFAAAAAGDRRRGIAAADAIRHAVGDSARSGMPWAVRFGPHELAVCGDRGDAYRIAFALDRLLEDVSCLTTPDGAHVPLPSTEGTVTSRV